MDAKLETVKIVECDRLFVYGTLQSGQSRHHLLDGLYYEKATLYGYKIVQPPTLGFPFIVEDPDAAISGEIYFEVTSLHWKELDKVEGEGSLYHRILVEVETEKKKKWTVYLYSPARALAERFGY